MQKQIRISHGKDRTINPQKVDWSAFDRQRAAKSKAICEHCSGLDRCTQEEAGLMVEGIEENGIYYTTRKRCKLKVVFDNARKIEGLFKYAKIPKMFRNDTWSDYELTPENEKAVSAGRWLENSHEGKGLLLFGSRGTGKTKLVSIVTREKIKQGHKVLFSSVPDLIQSIRSSFDKGKTDELLEEIRDVEVLVMDDLGVEKVTDWVSEQMFSIVNHRLNKGLQTIITSNYSPEQLIIRLSPKNKNGEVEDDEPGYRIVSRIKEMCYVVNLSGEDRRMRR